MKPKSTNSARRSDSPTFLEVRDNAATKGSKLKPRAAVSAVRQRHLRGFHLVPTCLSFPPMEQRAYLYACPSITPSFVVAAPSSNNAIAAGSRLLLRSAHVFLVPINYTTNIN